MIAILTSLSFLALSSLGTSSKVSGNTCSISDNSKVDCGYAGIQQSDCENKGCCWVPAGDHSTVPWCFYPGTTVDGYALTNMHTTSLGWEGTLTLNGSGSSTYGSDIQTLKLEVLMEAEDYLRVKITDPYNVRWEVPQSLVKRPQVTKAAPSTNYSFTYTSSPFSFEVKRNSDDVTIFQFGSTLIYKDQYIEFTTSFDSNAKTFGLGESARLNHAHTPGSIITMWARDEPALIKNTNLYGSYPMYLQMVNGQAQGAMLMNSNGLDVYVNSNSLTFKTIGGIIDLYIFNGPTANDVAKQYTSVVGRPALMPYWSLGFHNCKYGYKSVWEVEDVVKGYLDAGIPLDTQWMDIDYMEAYRDFTTDPTNFPMSEMTSFVDYLHKNGMKFIPIIDPGIMVYSNYDAYNKGIEKELFLKDIEGNFYLGQVWPGPTYFPDFFHPATQDYWTEQLSSFYSTVPMDGLWIDMNEIANFCNSDGKGQVCVNSAPSGCPAPGASQTDCCLVCSTVDSSNKFDFPPYAIHNNAGLLSTKTVAMSSVSYGNVSSYDAHNLYGLTEQIATRQSLIDIRGKRPFVLSRSSFMGTGVQAAKWTGDNGAYWDDLKSSIVSIMDFSIFGVPMIGADICGFLDNTNEELCARWIEVGAFYPFSRDHSAIGTINQELYIWDSVATAARNALGMRYQLLPYLYTLFYDAHVSGSLLSRALWVNFPSDQTSLTIERQFMLGSAILVSPVVEQGATSVSAYFPPGLWYNFQTRKLDYNTVGGGAWKTIDTPLTATNVHVLGGNVVPLQESASNTVLARQTPFTLLVALNSAGTATGSLFWDDGEQIELSNSLSVSYAASAVGSVGSVSNTIVTNTYSDASTFKLNTIQVLGISLKAPSSYQLNGVPLDASQVSVDLNSGVITFSSLNLAISSSFELNWS